MRRTWRRKWSRSAGPRAHERTESPRDMGGGSADGGFVQLMRAAAEARRAQECETLAAPAYLGILPPGLPQYLLLLPPSIRLIFG